MKRRPIYAATPRTPAAEAAPVPPPAAIRSTPAAVMSPLAPPRPWRFVVASLLLGALAAWSVLQWAPRAGKPLTQKDIDRAVLHTLQHNDLPSSAAKAYAAVGGSVVRVIGYSDPPAPTPGASAPAARKGPPEANRRAVPKEGRGEDREDSEDKDDERRGVGTGVVIIDNGTILTNLHVVYGAKRIEVTFADGTVSEADITGLQPENDLAVLRARRIPDDLKAATLRSTGDLALGDRVTAVGFPFGIGPSVSHGVVSGLKREFRSPQGRRILTNLIQFDAAANPGNSGGPLVTDDGAVVGIVTAIYNPTAERFFVGIGFAVPIENAAQAAGMPPF
jgi:serine protease DegQ